MALPHPHGLLAGQVGHLADIDTGDVSGSTGGKFVGFGEFGTSAAANRPHWALSENIDYTYQILGVAKAVPAADAFVSSGQYNYQMAGSVFVGDATYPGVPGVSEPEGMRLLFSVLDGDYKELTSPAGDEVRVARVRDAADITDIYQAGFATNPTVTFKTIDPSTGGDVDNPYTIPAAQSVRLMHGEESSLENLPTDAFIRFKVNAGAEVPAGVILQDGTRPMVANFDMNGNSIFDITNLLGESGQPMILRSFDNLTLQGDNTMTLKDGWLSSAIGLSQSGEPVLASSQYNSLVGSINNIYNVVSGQLVAKRFLDRGGDVTSTDGGQQIHYPTLNYIQKGEVRSIAAGTLVVSNLDKDAVITISETGVLTDKGANAVLETDLPVVGFYYDTGGTPGFTRVVDIRQPMNIRMERLPITVGDEPGCDFTDLKDAIECANEYYKLVSNDRRTEILILGECELSDKVEVNAPMWVHSPTLGTGIVRMPNSATTTSSIFTYNGTGSKKLSCVFENFEFYYDKTTVPAGGLIMFENMPSGSVYRKIDVKEGTGSKTVGTLHDIDFSAANMAAGDYRIDIEDCDAVQEGSAAGLVVLRGAVTGRRIHVKVDGCLVQNGTGLLSIVNISGAGNTAKLDAVVTDSFCLNNQNSPIFDLEAGSSTALNSKQSRVVIDGVQIEDAAGYIFKGSNCGYIWMERSIVEDSLHGYLVGAGCVINAHRNNLTLPSASPLMTINGPSRVHFSHNEVWVGSTAPTSLDTFEINWGSLRIENNNFDGGAAAQDLFKFGADVANVSLVNNAGTNYVGFIADNASYDIDRCKMIGNNFSVFGRGVHLHGEAIVFSQNTMDTVTLDALYVKPDRAGAMVVGNQFYRCGAYNNKCIVLTNQNGAGTDGAASLFMGNVVKECGLGSSVSASVHQKTISVEAKWTVQGNTVTNSKGSNVNGRNDQLSLFHVDVEAGASIIGNYAHINQDGFTPDGYLNLFFFNINTRSAMCMGNVCDFRNNSNNTPQPAHFHGIYVHPDVKYSIFALNVLLPLQNPFGISYDCDFIYGSGADRNIWLGNLGRNSSMEIACSSATGDRSYAGGNMVWDGSAMSDSNCYTSDNHTQSG